MKFLVDGKPSSFKEIGKRYTDNRAEMTNNVAAYIAEQAQTDAPILQDGTKLSEYIKLKPMEKGGESALVGVDHPAALRAHEYPYDSVVATSSLEHRSQTGGVRSKFLSNAAFTKVAEIVQYMTNSIAEMLRDQRLKLMGTKAPNQFEKFE